LSDQRQEGFDESSLRILKLRPKDRYLDYCDNNGEIIMVMSQAPSLRIHRREFLTRACVALLCLVIIFPLAAHAEPGAVQKLAPGVFVWQGDRDKREPANCMWVIFKDYVVVIDANFPWAAHEILTKIKETTEKPIRYVLNTHYHSDHSFGNSIFTDAGATIVNSEATDAENRDSKGFATWNDAAHPLTGAHQEYASITFSDRLVFDDGTQRVEMIRLGPAHSKGDSVAYLPKQRIVATGDLCVTWGFGNNVGDPGAS